ncbi:MAG: hypothetical protein ACK5B6_01875, partial [Bacteroidia bacterium]
ILLFPGLLIAQAGQPTSKKSVQKSVIQPQRLESTAKSREPAMMQAESDEANSLEKTVKQPEYWLNAYTSQRNDFTASEGHLTQAEEMQLSALVNEAEQSIAASFELNYMKLRQNRNKSVAGEFLREAVKKGGLTHPLLLPEMAWIAERNNDMMARNRALEAYQAAGQISQGQTIIAKMSATIAGTDALIITNGEFDTYPLWLSAPNARVISLAMLEDKVWLRRSLNAWDPSLKVNSINDANDLMRLLSNKTSKPVYVSLSLRPDLLNAFSQSLFPIGPLALLQKNESDLTAQLRAFYLSASFEKDFLNIPSSDSYVRVTANLLPGLVTLYRSGERISQEERAKVKALIALVSSKSGKKITYE